MVGLPAVIAASLVADKIQTSTAVNLSRQSKCRELVEAECVGIQLGTRDSRRLNTLARVNPTRPSRFATKAGRGLKTPDDLQFKGNQTSSTDSGGLQLAW